LQGQILDHGGWEIIAVTRKPGFQCEGLQEQGKSELPPRCFTPQEGLGEDPVTGSLNASLAGWLIGTGQAPSSYVAAQGTAMGRRGRVHISQVGDQVWVGGDTVIGVIGTVQL